MNALVERTGVSSNVALESFASPASNLEQYDKNSLLFGGEKVAKILNETDGNYSLSEGSECNLVKLSNLSQKGYMCKVCGKTFGVKSSAVRHISTVHFLERRLYCPLCKTGFKHKTHLKRHLLWSCKMKK